jgi:hypothetical protein
MSLIAAPARDSVKSPPAPATLELTVNTNRLIVLVGVAAAAVAILATAGGCDRKDDGIRAYSAPKEPPPAPRLVRHVPPAEEGELKWKAPAEWPEIPHGQMSLKDYQVSTEPPIKLTVTRFNLMGSLETTVVENINRWRKQLGLPPSSATELAKSLAETDADGRPVFALDVSSDPSAGPVRRMLAALVLEADGAWAFKVMGPADAVGPQKGRFDELVKSLRYEAADEKPAKPQAEKGSPAEDAAAPVAGISEMPLPQGWHLLPPDPQRSMMGGRSIRFGDGKAQGEVVITHMGAASLSNIMLNVNRWRSQVGLPPAPDDSAHPATRISFAQGPGLIREFAAPENVEGVRKRQWVAYTQFPKSDTVWFFRLVGPYDLATQAKPQFDAFVKAVKFDDAR